jgi:Uma2 family endonuclease
MKGVDTMGKMTNKSGIYSYGDYLNWDDECKYQILDGIAYMSAAPSRRHQEIQVELLRQISNYLLGKDCKVYGAPFDVRFGDSELDENIMNVVQPDIAIVCDKSKLDDRGCIGAPDWIIEIISPSTASIDYIKKLKLYEEQKVKEYWIVHPTDRIIMIYKLQNNKYGRPEIFSDEGFINTGLFTDFSIQIEEIFKE